MIYMCVVGLTLSCLGAPAGGRGGVLGLALIIIIYLIIEEAFHGWLKVMKELIIGQESIGTGPALARLGTPSGKLTVLDAVVIGGPVIVTYLRSVWFFWGLVHVGIVLGELNVSDLKDYLR